jgi:trans-2,3-dihydro-3-hydroxyanthranilate isomerase
MFAPLDNIPEDPATGSAAATLTAYLAGETAISLTIHQGVEMGRPSVIQTSARDGQVTVSGAAVKTMEGRLTV